MLVFQKQQRFRRKRYLRFPAADSFPGVSVHFPADETGTVSLDGFQHDGIGEGIFDFLHNPAAMRIFSGTGTDIMHPDAHGTCTLRNPGNFQINTPVRCPDLSVFQNFDSRYIFAAGKHGPFLCQRILEDFCLGSDGFNPAGIHNGDAVRHPEYFVPVMGYQDHGFSKLPDHLPNLLFQPEPLSSLRRHFGQMLQDVFLFSGTIRSNILLREEGITDEEVWEACKYVNADSFINKLEDGLDEIVRERGNNFSAGQRQLLSFARTIIHKPSVMILDEATANIDTETELLIQDSLEKMKNIGTMLIVAHRLSTIQHSDNIILLSHGKIIEQGNHQELLKQKGRYYQLYTLQYTKQQLQAQ